jgi:hypothetical protein
MAAKEPNMPIDTIQSLRDLMVSYIQNHHDGRCPLEEKIAFLEDLTDDEILRHVYRKIERRCNDWLRDHRPGAPATGISRDLPNLLDGKFSITSRIDHLREVARQRREASQPKPGNPILVNTTLPEILSQSQPEIDLQSERVAGGTIQG